jgi:basic membrane lipoprotein Med (substrate-binding protein (PBP1-ABC) superfamily)
MTIGRLQVEKELGDKVETAISWKTFAEGPDAESAPSSASRAKAASLIFGTSFGFMDAER